MLYISLFHITLNHVNVNSECLRNKIKISAWRVPFGALTELIQCCPQVFIERNVIKGPNTGVYNNLSLPACRELSAGAAHSVIASHSICAELSALMESQGCKDNPLWAPYCYIQDRINLWVFGLNQERKNEKEEIKTNINSIGCVVYIEKYCCIHYFCLFIYQIDI